MEDPNEAAYFAAQGEEAEAQADMNARAEAEQENQGVYAEAERMADGQIATDEMFHELVEDEARKYADLRKNFDIKEEMHYNPDGMKRYHAFRRGAYWVLNPTKNIDCYDVKVTGNPMHPTITIGCYLSAKEFQGMDRVNHFLVNALKQLTKDEIGVLANSLRSRGTRVIRPEVSEMIAKVHEEIEGRYALDAYDLGIIHSLLCDLQ